VASVGFRAVETISLLPQIAAAAKSKISSDLSSLSADTVNKGVSQRLRLSGLSNDTNRSSNLRIRTTLTIER